MLNHTYVVYMPLNKQTSQSMLVILLWDFSFITVTDSAKKVFKKASFNPEYRKNLKRKSWY